MRLSEHESGDAELPVYRLDNGEVALAFLPSVGGRLLSVSSDGREFLWRNPCYFDDDLRAVLPRRDWTPDDSTFATWANVGGSKTWPAPQGWERADQWPGPPGSVLDAGVWSIRSVSDGVVELTSPADDRTGVQIAKTFSLPTSGRTFRQNTTFTNVSDRVVSWAVWEVVQVASAPGGQVDVASSDNALVNLGDYHGTLYWANSGGSTTVPVQQTVAKRGFPSATGAIGYRDPSGAAIRLQFDPIVGALYPDGGSRAELWMQAPLDEPLDELDGLHPDAYLVELEVLSPLTTLRPGETVGLDLLWEVAGAPSA